MDIHIRERSLPYLQPVERDFYRKLIRYYKELDERLKKALKNGKLDEIFKLNNEMKNLYDIISDIYRIRLEKLLKKAIKIVEENDTIPEGLTEEEEELMKNVIYILKEFRRRIFETEYKQEEIETKVIEKRSEKSEEKIEKLEKEKKKEEVEYIVVKALEDIPEIVGIDGVTYGPFKKNDIALLPKENAKALRNKKLVEII